VEDVSCWLRTKRSADARPDGFRDALSVDECAAAGGGELEESTRASATDRQRISRVRANESFLLESLERRVHGADRVITPGARRDVTTDREPVGLLVEATDGQEDRELE
jgi:hypothetical protein